MPTQRRRAARLLAGALAALMVLCAAPLTGTAAAADPLPPLANPLAEGAVCDGMPTNNPFVDLMNESANTRQVILCLVATELTAGTTANTFTPGGTVTRRQMALFIKRTADLLDDLETDLLDLKELPAYDNTPDYTDIGAEDPVFRQAIGQLTQAGIVSGLGDGTFRPGAPVTRRQMAAFVNRLQAYLVSEPFRTQNDYFDDDNGDPGETNLNALASVGIFQGNGAGRVDPGGTLTRRQMANILMRYVQVHYAVGTINSPFEDPGEEPGEGNQTFAVTPADARTVEEGTVTQFSVSGITGDEVDIALVECRDVRIADNGVVTFSGTNPGGTGGVAWFFPADAGDTNQVDADITVIDGVAVNEGMYALDVEVDDGTLTFSVTAGAAPDCYVALVFDDASGNDRLDLDEDEAPTEEFGVSGAISIVAGEAGSGELDADEDITFVDKDSDLFSTDDVTYYYDGNDEFQIEQDGDCERVTMAQFEAALSAGDELVEGSIYRDTVEGQSVFCLRDVAPAPPTNVVAQAPTGDNAGETGIQIEFMESSTETVVSYDVFRALAVQPTITGQPVTCPPSTNSAYAKVGSVDDENPGEDGDDGHSYFDDDVVLAPASTPANPSYCYYVIAVDETGDVSVPSGLTQATAAFAGDPEGTAPRFASAEVGLAGLNVVVTYDQPIDCTTVVNSDFRVEFAILVVGPTTQNTVTGHTCNNNGANGVGQVDIAVQLPMLVSTVIVTAREGGDGNTVGNDDTPPLFQAVNDAVQALNVVGAPLP